MIATATEAKDRMRERNKPLYDAIESGRREKPDWWDPDIDPSLQRWMSDILIGKEVGIPATAVRDLPLEVISAALTRIELEGAYQRASAAARKGGTP